MKYYEPNAIKLYSNLSEKCVRNTLTQEKNTTRGKKTHLYITNRRQLSAEKNADK